MTSTSTLSAATAVETPVYELSIVGDCWSDTLVSHTKVDPWVVEFVLERILPNTPCNPCGEWEQDSVFTYKDLSLTIDGLDADFDSWSGFSVLDGTVLTSDVVTALAGALNRFLSLPQEEQEARVDAYKQSLQDLRSACFG